MFLCVLTKQAHNSSLHNALRALYCAVCAVLRALYALRAVCAVRCAARFVLRCMRFVRAAQLVSANCAARCMRCAARCKKK